MQNGSQYQVDKENFIDLNLLQLYYCTYSDNYKLYIIENIKASDFY